MLGRFFIYTFCCFSMCISFGVQAATCPEWIVTKNNEQYVFSDKNMVAKWILVGFIENELEYKSSLEKNHVTPKNARLMMELNQGRHGLILGNGNGKLHAYAPFYDGDMYEFYSTEVDAQNYANKYIGCDFGENFLENISKGLHKNNVN